MHWYYFYNYYTLLHSKALILSIVILLVTKQSSSSRPRFPPIIDIPSHASESEDEDYSDKGSIENSTHYSIDLNEASDGDISKIEEKSVMGLAEDMSRMTLPSSKTKKSVKGSSGKYSLQTDHPFMLYDFVNEGQKMIAIELLVKSTRKSDFRVRVSRCGNKLYIQTAIPSFFAQYHRLAKVNADDGDFTRNTSRAIAFQELADEIEEEETTTDGNVMFGSPQVIHLTSTCDPNVEANWSIQYFKMKPKFKLSDNFQYDAVLNVEVESIVKPKKRVVKKDDMIYDSDSDSDQMSNAL